jgi:hypothetical protein
VLDVVSASRVRAISASRKKTRASGLDGLVRDKERRLMAS